MIGHLCHVTRRCMASMAAVDGLLYVAGGCDHSVSLKSVESYDPSSGEWTVLGDMSEARSGLGMAVIGHKLLHVYNNDYVSGCV